MLSAEEAEIQPTDIVLTDVTAIRPMKRPGGIFRGERRKDGQIYRGAGQAPQKETVDLFQGGIHHQHDEPYLGMVRRKPHG